MSSISAIASSVLGIQRGLEGAKRNAAEIASVAQFTDENPKELAESLVELKLNAVQVQASAKALKIMHETIGTLLDVTA